MLRWCYSEVYSGYNYGMVMLQRCYGDVIMMVWWCHGHVTGKGRSQEQCIAEPFALFKYCSPACGFWLLIASHILNVDILSLFLSIRTCPVCKYMHIRPPQKHLPSVQLLVWNLISVSFAAARETGAREQVTPQPFQGLNEIPIWERHPVCVPIQTSSDEPTMCELLMSSDLGCKVQASHKINAITKWFSKYLSFFKNCKNITELWWYMILQILFVVLYIVWHLYIFVMFYNA